MMERRPQMGSFFSQGTKRRGSPAYCKKGKREGIPADENGKPVNLNAYAKWEGVQTGGPFLVSESFALQLTTGGTEYVGSSADSGLNLQLVLHETSDPDAYDVALRLRVDEVIVEEEFWFDVDVRFRPPWGTTLVIRRALFGITNQQFQLLG